jgi:DNA-directed RNA polymerase specialized sigma24 family protein
MLGCSPSTVRAHASRALARLRTALQARPALEVNRD